VPVQLAAQAAGNAETQYYRGTPALSSPAAPPATHDAHFTGSCPAFSGATATCTVNFGDLGARAFAASDGGTTAFDPVTVTPNGFLFSATDQSANNVNFAAYQSGVPLTLSVTATAKAGASIAGYDGSGFSVGLSSNDSTPLARTANPNAGVATFANVGFVKLGGQAGSPFTPRLTATDSQLASSTATQNL